MRNPKLINKSTALTKSYSAIEVISEIENTIKLMKTNWDIIRSFNISDKGAIPKYDLRKTYQDNVRLENRIIELKTISLCINLGFKSIDQIPKDSSFPTIYVRSQLLSRIQNLKTINTKFDVKSESISFDKNFIDKEIRTLNQEVIKCTSELTEFNEKSKFVA